MSESQFFLRATRPANSSCVNWRRSRAARNRRPRPCLAPSKSSLGRDVLVIVCRSLLGYRFRRFSRGARCGCRDSPRIAIVHPHIANLQYPSRIWPDAVIRLPDAPPTHGAELIACHVSLPLSGHSSELDVSAPEQCCHHWIVRSEACGSAFPAHCRHCGARREFPVMSVSSDFNEGGTTIR